MSADRDRCLNRPLLLLAVIACALALAISGPSADADPTDPATPEAPDAVADPPPPADAEDEADAEPAVPPRDLEFDAVLVELSFEVADEDGELWDVTGEPVRFEAGRFSGWAFKTDEALPLATPAIGHGNVYVGAGYGAYEFYALDVGTGEIAWEFTCDDDGPTAAVVWDRFVAYNTESCTVFVHDGPTGELLWSEYLGDPLMNMPAIADGKLYMAYPTESDEGVFEELFYTQRSLLEDHYENCLDAVEILVEEGVYLAEDGMLTEELKAMIERRIEWYRQQIEETVAEMERLNDEIVTSQQDSGIGSHTLVALDVATGERIWAQAMQGDAISSPVIAGDAVYVTTFSGYMYCFGKDDGELRWLKNEKATCAPWIAGEQVYASHRSEGFDEDDADEFRAPREGVRSHSRSSGSTGLVFEDDDAPYLDSERRREAGVEALEWGLDEGVGFAEPPDAAGLEYAEELLGINTVAGGWAYQGSRPCVIGNTCFNAQGDTLQAVVATTGEVLWRVRYRPPPSDDGNEDAGNDDANGNDNAGNSDTDDTHDHQDSDGEPSDSGEADGDDEEGDGVTPVFEDGDIFDDLDIDADGIASLCPPVVVGGRLYLGTLAGDILCLDGVSGDVLWAVNIGHPIAYQPAVMNGVVYVGTMDGIIVALDTSDQNATGWPMWGGSASHNGPTTR